MNQKVKMLTTKGVYDFTKLNKYHNNLVLFNTNKRVYFSYRTNEIKQTPTLQKTDRKKTKRNVMQIHTLLRNVQFLTKVTGKIRHYNPC